MSTESCVSGFSFLRDGSSSTRVGSAADAWERSVELAKLAEERRLRPHLGLRPRGDGAATRAHSLLRAVHHAVCSLAAHQPSEARPARDVRRVPQCRASREAGRMPRRHVGRPAHSRTRGRLVRGGVRVVRLPVPAGIRAPCHPRRDAPGGPSSLDRGDGDVQGRARASRRCVLRPETVATTARRLGGRRWRAEDPPDRRTPRGRHQLAGRHRIVRAEVGAARAVLR